MISPAPGCGSVIPTTAVILPISSGDTAFRSSRLILAETFSLSQVRAAKRLLLSKAVKKMELFDDLSTTYLGVTFRNPFVLASAPPTATGDMVRRAFDAGWGGAVNIATEGTVQHD